MILKQIERLDMYYANHTIQTFELIVDGKPNGWSFTYKRKMDERMKCIINKDGRPMSWSTEKLAREGAKTWIKLNHEKPKR